MIPQPAHEAPTREEGSSSPFAQAKRFLEYLRADPVRAQVALQEPRTLARTLGLTLDPNEFRRLWDPAHAARVPADEATALEQEYIDYTHAMVRVRDTMRSGGRARDERLGVWRDRQLRRARLELGELKNTQIVHAPYAIELARGCSVGCWFCGVSAPKLSDIFLYTKANAALWHDVIRALSHRLGDAARFGFCYWATDPFDNPDYERFCVDMHAITGGFPQTTTAIPLRDAERTRDLLRLSDSLAGPVNRFSVLTKKLLDQVHDEFTAEELTRVELIPQNRESSMGYADAGRTRRRRMAREPDLETQPAAEQPPGTIACVSGFLINMVDRTIKLISPCAAGDRWPDGYVVYDEARFDDATSFAAEVDAMVGRRPRHAADLGRIRFAPRLSYERTETGFLLKSSGMRSRHEHPSAGPWLRAIGDAVNAGRSGVSGVALELALRFGVPEEQTHQCLEGLFQSGLFDEEPA